MADVMMTRERGGWRTAQMKLSPKRDFRAFRSNGRPYHITREVVGESERVSIQVAVLLAERWKGFSREGIERFLAAS